MAGDVILKDNSVEITGRLDVGNASCERITARAANVEMLEVRYRIVCDELNVRGADLLEHLDRLEKLTANLAKAVNVADGKVQASFTDLEVTGKLGVHGADFGQRVFNIERRLDELGQRVKALEG